MDPYFWTWIARYGGACLVVPVWLALSVRAARRGARWSAAVFAALGAVTAAGLGTHAIPLVLGAAVPAQPTGLAIALAAPYLAFAALALALPRVRPTRLDLPSLLPIALWPQGWPAWVLGVTLTGRSLTFPGAPRRRRLMFGLGLLAVASVLDGQHARVRDALPLSSGDAVRVVAAATSASE